MDWINWISRSECGINYILSSQLRFGRTLCDDDHINMKKLLLVTFFTHDTSMEKLSKLGMAAVDILVLIILYEKKSGENFDNTIHELHSERKERILNITSCQNIL